MMKMLFASAVLAVSGSAIAQVPGTANDSVPPSQLQLAVIHNDLQVISAQLAKQAPMQDPHTSCYYNGQAYSLGAVREGFRCESTGVHTKTKDGAIDRERSDPLRWIPSNTKAAGIGSAKID